MNAFLQFTGKVLLAYLAINVVTTFVPILGQLVYTPMALFRGITGIGFGGGGTNPYE